MGQNEDFLPPDIIRRLLSIVEQDDVIVIGGQATAIWAEHYRPQIPELFERGSVASQDLDFYQNDAAVRRLVRVLSAQVYWPKPDDHTPSAAKVVARFDNRSVTIDFMRDIKGVDVDRMRKRRVIFRREGPSSGEVINIPVMHPLDCVWSRFGNINLLRRDDDHSARQGRASLLVLARFLLDEIKRGRIKDAQDILMELGYLARKLHAGKPTHLNEKRQLFPEDILQAFSEHDAFDARWRTLTFGTELARVRTKLAHFRPILVDGAAHTFPMRQA